MDKSPRIVDRPFLWGSQYYRAPTPERDCWRDDFAKMRDMGFNSVKLWVQWRWSHRRGDRFVFDDVDELMALAAEHDLLVHINTVFDVAPHWLYEQYPDAKQVMNRQGVVEPHEVAHRQLAGNPGPCYSHPGALSERRKFLQATVGHFHNYDILDAWDIWNEPELCFPQRSPNIDRLACYCAHCITGFRHWLRGRYRDLDELNTIWGRCYEEWHEVEAPRTGLTIRDFVDWREYHVSVMTGEAKWRLAAVRELDPGRTAFLHVVPNLMSCFNTIGCATDDFALFADCDVAAASYTDAPANARWMTSVAEGKPIYNTETHVNFGMTNMHQRVLGLDDLVRTFVPQIGAGFRGFQFWQFRSETLGFEAPAWGLVNLDGSDRSVTIAAREFADRIRPHADMLGKCTVTPSRAAIWRSRANEIFHFCIHQSLEPLTTGVGAYTDALYRHNVPFRFVSDAHLASGRLDGIDALFMPMPYYLSQAEADTLDAWVRAGGVLLCEAHLAGYDGTRGRHSRAMPGCGLSDRWGIRESVTTSSYHLNLDQSEAYRGAATDDVRKALAAADSRGGRYFPIRLTDNDVLWGAERYAALEGASINALGTFDGSAPCLAEVRVGKGRVLYLGTNAGLGAAHGQHTFDRLVQRALASARLQRAIQSEDNRSVHVDKLHGPDGAVLAMAIVNRADTAIAAVIPGEGTYRGLFSGEKITLDESLRIAPGLVDLFVRD